MLNKIGFFQLDNLINNRVPFILVNMGPEILSWYPLSIFKDHVAKNQIETTEDQVLNQVQERKVSKDAAIVLLCTNGSDSEKLCSVLEENGYTNVYVINGGYQQMMTERSNP